ncbi:MAG: hypothetical protein ACRCXG_16310 [Vibrio sp.]
MGIKSFLRSFLSNLTKTQSELEGEHFTVCSNSRCNGAVSSKTGICSICGSFQFLGKGQKCGTESKTVVRALGKLDITKRLPVEKAIEGTKQKGGAFYASLMVTEISTSEYFDRGFDASAFTANGERLVVFFFHDEEVVYMARQEIFDLMISRFKKYKIGI